MKSFGKTDKGIQREKNEDAIFVSDEPIGPLPNLYIIADGMGGHKAGAFASKYAVKTFIEFVECVEHENPVQIIEEGIKEANHRLHKKSEENEAYANMGTTFIVATVAKEQVYIGNIGDSRLYCINQAINKITKDHSVVEEMLHTGNITEQEAREHPDRHIITRAVGIEPDIEVDTYEMVLTPEDMILMCSDGLTNMLGEEELESILTSDRSLEAMGEALIKQANANGGSDNISVILIRRA